MRRTKAIGQLKAGLKTLLRKAWNKSCEEEENMSDEEKLFDRTNLVTVINRIEENRENGYKQITCRSQEWQIVEKMLPVVLTEAKVIQESINPFLPRRHEDDSDTDWHRRVLYRTIRVLRLWKAAEDKRTVHGILRKHFNGMIRKAKQHITGEVARHVKGIQIDHSGAKQAFVEEKDANEREKEDKLAALVIPPIPTVRKIGALDTPRLQNPDSVARALEGDALDTTMKESASSEI